jgi:hypothetical protein
MVKAFTDLKKESYRAETGQGQAKSEAPKTSSFQSQAWEQLKKLENKQGDHAFIPQTRILFILSIDYFYS